MGNSQSAIGNRQSAIGNRQSAIGWIALISVATALSCADRRDEPLAVGISRAAIELGADSARILGMDTAPDWPPAAATSNERTEGAHSLVVSSNGWTELVSAPLAGVGDVGDAVQLDVRVPATVGWGEVRLIVQLPSAGEWWRDLGAASLVGVEPGAFKTLSWPVPSDLKGKLAGQYSDLRLRVVLNAPGGSYLLDNVRFLAEGASGDPLTEVLDFAIPSGEPLDAFAILGTDAVDICDRAEIRDAEGGYAKVGGVGYGTIRIGVEAHTGSVRAAAGVFLSERAEVHGNLDLAGELTTQSAWSIDGEVHQLPLTTQTVTRSLAFPATRLPDVHLEPGQSVPVPLEPGFRERLELKADAEAVLKAGDYFLDALVLHPGANLLIDDSSGTINLYVRSTVNLQGEVGRLGGGHPRLLLGYLGTGQVFVSAPFAGAIIAPAAEINLEGSDGTIHAGTFVGRRVRVAPGLVIEHQPLPWLIRGVELSEPVICSGAAVTARVELVDPAAQASVNGIPGETYTEQFIGDPGTRVLAVSATSPDGIVESQLVEFAVVACEDEPVRPLLFTRANRYQPDGVDFIVGNAPVFEDGTQQYTFAFGDGESATSPFPAVSHDYSAVLGPTEEYRVFDVAVTVHRDGVADSTTERTLLVWNSYAISKRRGSIEPVVEIPDARLRHGAGRYRGVIYASHREASPLLLTARRVDFLPCDPEGAPRIGTEEATAITLPVGESVPGKISFPDSDVEATDCAVRVHFWGTSEAGVPAQATAHFDLPSEDADPIVDPTTAALLDYVVEQGLVADPHLITDRELGALYRERRLPLEAISETLYAGYSAEPGGRCDPDDPGTLRPGYSCQPTGQWVVDVAKESQGDLVNPANSAHVENALKGDTLMVRSCKGPVGALLGAVDPPQIYTHVGMMTKNRVEVRHSTASEEYLIEAGSEGIFGEPTNGFNEFELRYQWPGSVTASVYEAFGGQRRLVAPNGEEYKIAGFNEDAENCFGTGVVYPRVLKPEPRFEAQIRPALHQAAEASKAIESHYRFSGYSDALSTGSPDPAGPAPVEPTSGDPYGDSWWGPQPTVCSSFVRQALVSAGIELDRDKNFPQPSPEPPSVMEVPGRDGLVAVTAPGVFLYDAAERRAAGDVLYAHMHKTATMRLWDLSDDADEYWWVGTAGVAAASAVGALMGGIAQHPEAYTAVLEGTGMGVLVTENVGLLAKWVTDTPRDVANQVTNCFATDFCESEARNSRRWRNAIAGVAVSPDDLMNYYDSPATGGPYGYHERLVYRGLRFRPEFTWQQSAGSVDLEGLVLRDGLPTDGALVEGAGIPGSTVVTSGGGLFSLDALPGPHIMLHASQWVGEEATGHLAETHACLVLESTDDGISYLSRVRCDDLTTLEDPVRLLPAVSERTGCYAADPVEPSLLVRIACDGSGAQLGEERYRERVELSLGGPDPAYRQVVISGRVNLYDCDCTNRDDDGVRNVYAVCNVSELEPSDSFSIAKEELCMDEIGLKVAGTCEYLPGGHVRVAARLTLFGSLRSHSCGRDEADSSTFEVEVAPGQAEQTGFVDLGDSHLCVGIGFLNSCNDSVAIYSGLNIANGIAP